MPWQEITFVLDAAQAEVYEDALLAAGALSVTLRDAEDQPILEPAPETTPLWDSVLLTAMFDADTAIDGIVETLRDSLQTDQLASYRVGTLEDREWRLTWKEHFRPMLFGERLWICPSGYERPSQDDAVIIDLDPGLAFGTGSHPTTALCLQWLDANPIENKTVIDYGCGSGILAIAAARLRARKVIAVDNDMQALQATMDNARLNGVDSIVTAYPPESIPISIRELKADILLANILLEPLLDLAPAFAGLIRTGADLVMSGILQTQEEELLAAYTNDFRFDACGQQEEWVRLHAIKK